MNILVFEQICDRMVVGIPGVPDPLAEQQSNTGAEGKQVRGNHPPWPQVHGDVEQGGLGGDVDSVAVLLPRGILRFKWDNVSRAHRNRDYSIKGGCFYYYTKLITWDV